MEHQRQPQPQALPAPGELESVVGWAGGLTGDLGGQVVCPDLVGGAEGLALGIFNRLAPPGKLMEETMALAKQIVAKPPHAMIRLKENMNNAVLESDFLPALDAEGVKLSTHLATAEGKLETL